MDTTLPLGRLSAGHLKSMVRQVDSVTSYCSTRPLLSQLGGPHPRGLLSRPLDKLSWEPFPLKPSPVDTALSHRSIIPCYTRKIPCTCPIPHPCPLLLHPQERRSGVGAHAITCSAPLHHCHPWPLGYSSHSHCCRCFSPPPLHHLHHGHHQTLQFASFL